MISVFKCQDIIYIYHVTTGDSKQDCLDLNAILNSRSLSFIIMIPDRFNYVQIMVPGLAEVSSLPMRSLVAA